MLETFRLQAAVPPDVERAAELLRAGRLVAFATETVYGLGANALSAEAVAGIFAAKQRPAWDPLIVHIASVDEIDRIALISDELRARVERLADAFWPGPLTMLVPKAPAVPDTVTAGRALVGVRVPAHPVAQALLRAAGLPIAAPSANRFMHTSPTTAAHVLADLDGRIACVLDGGPTTVGVESTVVDLTTSPTRLLRPGGVTLEDLRAILPDIIVPGSSASAASASQPASAEPTRAPGQMARHYAPHTRLIVFDAPDATGVAAQSAMLAAMLAEAAAARARGERVGALA